MKFALISIFRNKFIGMKIISVILFSNFFPFRALLGKPILLWGLFKEGGKVVVCISYHEDLLYKSDVLTHNRVPIKVNQNLIRRWYWNYVS